MRSANLLPSTDWTLCPNEGPTVTVITSVAGTPNSLGQSVPLEPGSL